MTNNTEIMYGLLMENRLDLMYLPSGVVAWLWSDDRPQEQIDMASQIGVEAKRYGNPIQDGALLRADHNVLVLKAQDGTKISVYPNGGLGIDGRPASVDDIINRFQGFGDELNTRDPSSTSMVPQRQDEPIDDLGQNDLPPDGMFF